MTQLDATFSVCNERFIWSTTHQLCIRSWVGFQHVLEFLKLLLRLARYFWPCVNFAAAALAACWAHAPAPQIALNVAHVTWKFMDLSVYGHHVLEHLRLELLWNSYREDTWKKRFFITAVQASLLEPMQEDTWEADVVWEHPGVPWSKPESSSLSSEKSSLHHRTMLRYIVYIPSSSSFVELIADTAWIATSDGGISCTLPLSATGSFASISFGKLGNGGIDSVASKFNRFLFALLNKEKTYRHKCLIGFCHYFVHSNASLPVFLLWNFRHGSL